MTTLLRFFGMGLIAASAIAFFKEYKKQLEQRYGLCQGFLSLLSHIRRQIDCYLTPPDRLLCDFREDFLEKCGYLERAVKRGVGEAYFEIEEKLGLPTEVKEILHSFFLGFGRDYREGTLKELDRGISSLEKCLAKEKTESEKDLKIAGILAVSFALGIIILII